MKARCPIQCQSMNRYLVLLERALLPAERAADNAMTKQGVSCSADHATLPAAIVGGQYEVCGMRYEVCGINYEVRSKVRGMRHEAGGGRREGGGRR